MLYYGNSAMLEIRNYLEIQTTPSHTFPFSGIAIAVELSTNHLVPSMHLFIESRVIVCILVIEMTFPLDPFFGHMILHIVGNLHL